ncbi:MAG: MBL fold metallo-hydrolase [Clostridia bacterium]|nr:MBL fold metallo-hydrolase [Clostridia bacterium]
MLLSIVPCGPVAANMMFVGADGGKTVAVIDPSDAALALAILKERGWTLSDILITHRHFDHLLGVAELKKATGATIYISEKDAEGLKSNLVSLSMAQRITLEPVEPDVLLHDGDTFEAAGLSFRVLETPGHTIGGITFVCDEQRCAFVGDTLFADGYGRFDLPTGDFNALSLSIRNVLFALPDDYRLYPGHDEPTTVEREKRSNPINYEGMPWSD